MSFMRLRLLAETRSHVVCSLFSSSIFDTRFVTLRETLWMFLSTTSMWWLFSEICDFSFCVSSMCVSMDFFSTLNWSISFSRSCFMDVICEWRYCISLSFLSLRLHSCSCLSCSWRTEVCSPRSSFSMASSPSLCSRIASCTFWSASSRRCMPTRDDLHCCSNCFFSNSIASISLPASRKVCVAASVSCFCATSCASSSAFCSVIRFTSSFMLSRRMSCLCFTFSMCLMWSSALYVARRVTWISAFICSLYSSTCLRVMLSWLSSSCDFESLFVASSTSCFFFSYCAVVCFSASSSSDRLVWIMANLSCSCSSCSWSFASCCWAPYRVTPISSRCLTNLLSSDWFSFNRSVTRSFCFERLWAHASWRRL
mmetsp:Transcript_119335/g.338382  ORF Transcript_119335/g.338382 Transcript_119335/m.338382 type:complete len:369 (-) Transcript_119335:200-1306(-)